MVVTYSAVMSYVVLERFQAFQTNAFDLGIFNQAFTTALHGRLFFETPDQHVIVSGSFLGTHFNLLMFLLLPIYAILPYAQTLLVLQTGVIALGAVPIYLVSRKILKSQKLPLVMAGIYLVNPFILNLNLFDFHLEAFLPFFLGMFYYYYLVANWRGYSLFLALSLITVEFASVLVVAICLAHAIRSISLSRKDRHLISSEINRSRALILLSTAIIAAVTFYVVLFLSGILSGNSSSVQAILSGFVSPSSSIQVIYQKSEFWALPIVILMFLPLLAPSQLVVVAPYFAVTVLGSASSTSYSLGYQYAGAFVVPFLILATIFSLQKLRARRINLGGLMIGVLLFSLVTSPFSPLVQGKISGIAYNEGFPIVTSHDEILDEAIGLIPAGASVLTQNNLFPQVSNRADAYVYLTNENTPIQYVLADSTSPWYTDKIWGTQSMSYWLPHYISTGGYGVVVNDDGVTLLEANYTGSPTLTGSTTYLYNYHSLDLYSGSEVSMHNSLSGTVFLHASSDENGVTFWFGPYASLPPGRYAATFSLMTSATTIGSLDLQVSNTVNATYSSSLAQEEINQTSFTSPYTWSEFTLTFQYTPQQALAGTLEFKGGDAVGGPFYLDYVQVAYLGPATG
jgi:uncharacterized membrane protein